MQLTVNSLGKDFGDRSIFRDISFDIGGGESVAITGPNGSGKTTLVRILCHLIRPSSGEVKYHDKNTQISEDDIYHHIGLVGPYLELYEELTAYENLMFFARLKKVLDSETIISKLIDRLHLSGRENDPVKNYSSGMKQRLKYIFAMLGQPSVLFLDEPTSNLDSEGIATVYDIIEEQKKSNLVVLATNDENDLKFGDNLIAISS